MRFEIRTEVGYETGTISDLYCTPKIGFGVFDWLDVWVEGTGIHFFEDNSRTLCGYFTAAKARVIQRPGFPFNIFPYISITHVLTDPVVFDAETRDGESKIILSPHTDKGMDLTVGFASIVRFNAGPIGILIPFGMEYSRCILREYYPPFDESSAKNRIIWHITPGVAVFDDLIAFSIQNRFLHWFDRGFTFEMTPAFTLTTPAGLSLSLGAVIPVYAGGIVKVVVDFGFTTPSLETLRGDV